MTYIRNAAVVCLTANVPKSQQSITHINCVVYVENYVSITYYLIYFEGNMSYFLYKISSDKKVIRAGIKQIKNLTHFSQAIFYKKDSHRLPYIIIHFKCDNRYLYVYLL